MPSLQARVLSFFLRHTLKPLLARVRHPRQVRAMFESRHFPVPRDVTIRPAKIGGVEGEWVATDRSHAVLVYVHGGCFVACTPRAHRPITTRFAQRGLRVFAPAYRRAPEAPFPAAVHDVADVLRALREELGDDVPIFIAGDSAGGSLALAAMLKLRDEGVRLPAAAVLFSPSTNLCETPEGSRTSNVRACSFVGPAGLPWVNDWYLGGADPRHPWASPLHAELAGLPPMLVHVGESEWLRDDSTVLVERARAAGVDARIVVWPVVPHAWQIFHRYVPEARQSIDAAAAFLRRHAAPAAPDHRFVIVGSGFAGLCMAIRLREAGIDDFIILESADDIGGTWRVNTYPGCACDIPSHLYSLSFAPSHRWTRMYPSQPEIWRYMLDLVEKYRLRPFIRFNTEMQEAVYDEASATWRLTTADGRQITSRFVVSAIGGLSRPAWPRLPGLERFEGRMFHSATWDHDYDLAGKRVAVIGTGASAVQFVPQIVPKVAQLHLFQRTPPWVLPRADRPIRGWEQFLMRWLPGYRWLFRARLYAYQEMLALGFTVAPQLMRLLAWAGRRYIARQVADPALRAKLTPDYTPGCKRLLTSNDYYPALTAPNVEVVTDAIAEVRPRSIVTRDGIEREVDAIILGTGFRATDTLSPIRIVGRGGVDINDAWRDGMEAHYGVTVAGYPNLFLLVGPNTGLGHNSILFMIEAQVEHVMQCLRLLGDGVSIETRAEAQAGFNRALQGKMRQTVWTTGCRSWYLDARGVNTTLWPGFTFTFWLQTRRPRRSAYRICFES